MLSSIILETLDEYATLEGQCIAVTRTSTEAEPAALEFAGEHSSMPRQRESESIARRL
jgi:hypothetical protein